MYLQIFLFHRSPNSLLGVKKKGARFKDPHKTLPINFPSVFGGCLISECLGKRALNWALFHETAYEF